jgi:acetyl esterase/lipase
MLMRNIRIGTALLLITCAIAAAPSYAAREIDSSQLTDTTESNSAAATPADVVTQRNVAYGSAKAQALDVYAPARAQHAPIIFMVHGGAWMIGDKTNANVVENKIARWVTRGFIFVSANYRMLPELNGLQQADDVARALAFTQTHAAEWGGDPTRVIVMGHSAGAHLVALLSSAPEKAYAFGAKPWLGTIALDSAALDVVDVMQRSHLRFYDKAFGSDPTTWRQASPLQNLSKQSLPILTVCSTQRGDNPCAAAQAYIEKAAALGVRAEKLEQNLSHKQINQNLGLPNSYTDAVEDFMRSLDDSIANFLTVAAKKRPD